jgi:NAD-dependent SIR2 family protein deacetylase
MNYKERIEKSRRLIKEADYILIGGGAGLSAAAGVDFSGPIFRENFAEFIDKYGITDLYSGGFYPFKTNEEKWAFWAKHIFQNRYEIGATKLYQELYDLIKDKNYYVLSTNVDSQFVKGGFPDDKVFEVQGDYCYFQCKKPCHDKLYYNEEQVKRMVVAVKDCMIPTELIPKCPVCGGSMEYNLRVDASFVQDETWYRHADEYDAFLEKVKDAKLVLLELGVGYNTPTIIRYPFENIVNKNKGAMLIRLNRDEPEGVNENKDKTISFSEDMAEVFNDLKKEW